MKKKHSAEFKSKVAFEAAKGDKTIAELSSIYEVHAVQIGQWKKELMNNMSEIFSDKRKKDNKQKEIKESELLQKIGELTIENEYLKKKSLMLR